MIDESGVGSESVVIGRGVPSRVGDRSVVIGATDDRGNTRIGGGTAIGYGSRADQSSVAIGAYACAGTDALLQLQELRDQLQASGERTGAEAADQLLAEIRTQEPNRRTVRRLWGEVKVAATTNEALLLVHEVAKALPLLAR
jgi:hypothetical protein